MAIQKLEADEADLQAAYDRARSIGLFLVEKYAREVLRAKDGLAEFVVMPDALFPAAKVFFTTPLGHQALVKYEDAKGLVDLLERWDGLLNLTSEPMRFTADGPVRREW